MSTSFFEHLFASKFMQKHFRIMNFFIFVIVFLMTLFTITCAFQTAITQFGKDLVTIEVDNFMSYRTPHGSIFELRAQTVLNEDAVIRVSRELVHKPSGEYIILPASEIWIPRGVKKANVVFPLPMVIFNGEWCLNYTIKYSKPFSLITRQISKEIACTRIEGFVSAPRATENEN